MTSLVRSKTFKAFPLVSYVIALGFDIVAFVDGFRLMGTSLVGGIALVAVSLVLAAMIGWRISFKWKQLHTDPETVGTTEAQPG